MNATTNRIPFVPFGLSLSVLLGVSYVLCVLFGLWSSSASELHHELFELLPGFTWLTWGSFFVGLAWSIAAAWYVAVIFGPLYNYFSARGAR